MSADVSSRFKAAIAAIGVSQAEIARRAGSSQSFVNQVCRGARQPSLELLTFLTTEHQVSASWILADVGPMVLRDLEASGLPTTTPPLTADVAVRWDEMVDGAAGRLKSEGRVLLHQVVAPTRETHPLHDLVNRLLQTCPPLEITRAEGYLEGLVERCHGEPLAKSA